jgi:hypothetical protein
LEGWLEGLSEGWLEGWSEGCWEGCFDAEGAWDSDGRIEGISLGAKSFCQVNSRVPRL